MITELQKTYLDLLRLGLGNVRAVQLPMVVDWSGLQAFAEEQGLSAVVLDGIEKLPDDIRPAKIELLQWIGEVLQGYEYRYDSYCKAISELAGFYNEHGFKMMVLKGYACALDWPKPEHRPCGDIDIWLFGQQEAADKELVSIFKFQEAGFKIDKSHLHHTVFNWGEFMVENHFEIVDTKSSKSNAKIEKLFQELGDERHTDSTESTDKGWQHGCEEVNGEKVYLPSPNFHALFLIRHAVLHFNSDGLTIRHALDWGFFVKKYTKQIDWEWLLKVLDEYHMRDFYNCLNAICVENLGFDVNIFPQAQFEPNLKERVLEDLLSTSSLNEEPKGLIKRIIFKYRRRKAREWKHNLCYEEPLWSHLLSSLWLHITHPGMI